MVTWNIMRFSFLFLAMLIAANARTVSDLTAENFDSTVGGDKNVLVFFFAPWCGHCSNFSPEYEKVASSYARATDTLIARVDGDAHTGLADRYDVQGYPTLKFFPAKSEEPSATYDGLRTAEGVVSFLNELTGNDVRMYSADDAVKELTAESFDDIVLDTSKDVFVEFYAHWCGHCRKLAPIFEQVAKNFYDQEVTIARIDADVHSSIGEKYEVKAFPTLKYFPRNDKSGKPYEGPRNAEGFTRFLNKAIGTELAANGGLVQNAGCLERFDQFAKTFKTSTDQRQVIHDAEAELSTLEDPDEKEKARYYIKTMKSVLEKGSSFIVAETTRLRKLMQQPLPTRKVHTFQKRLNVLQRFV